MLKKLIITLKYGERKARIVLISVIILLIGGLSLLLFGIFKSSIIPFGAGAILMIIALFVLFSFSFVDIDVNIGKKEKKKKEPEPEPEEKKPEKEEAAEPDIDFSMFADDLSDVAIGVGGISFDKKEEKEEDKDKDKEKDQKEKKKKKKGKDKEKSDKDGEDKDSDIMPDDGDEPEDDDEEEETLPSGSVRVKTNSGKTYEVKKPTPKQIKARKKMLKVRKDDRRFTPIIVDSWKNVSALRTPAFVQDRGKTANVILVEGALRTEIMPMSKFLEVTYQKNVEEKLMESYEEIKKDTDVDAVFGDLLPIFYPGGGRGGQQITCKNLYVLGGEMAITPRSLRKLFNKFDFEFKVFDSLDIKGNYSDYFKEAYENRIFWTDNVINQADYQDRIRLILQTMVDDKKLLNYDFEKDLSLMVRYNLITKEYADYYKARKNDNIKIRI